MKQTKLQMDRERTRPGGTFTIPVHVPQRARNDWDRAGMALLTGALLSLLIGTLVE